MTGSLPAVALLLVFPLAWLFLTAFKTELQAIAVPPLFVFTPTLENFHEVQERSDYLLYAKNSVITSVLSTLRLFNLETIPGHQAAIAVTLALMANLVFKIGLVISIGGAKLARHALPGLLAIGVGMAIGLLLV